MKLSVLIPVYNEESSVEAIVRRVAAMDIASLKIPAGVDGAAGTVETEIIAVDDCSTDDSTDILARLHGGPAEAPGEGPRSRPTSSSGAEAPSSSPAAVATALRPKEATDEEPAGTPAANSTVAGLRVIRHGHNQGKGAAIQTGLVAATGDYVIIQDADFEYDPADIPRLLQPIVSGQAKVVYGARPLDGSGGRLILDLGNRGLSVVTNLLYGTHLHDMETCYKVLPTALLRSFNLECSRFDMEPEITAKVTRSGYKIVEVPISYHPRAGGKKLSARKDGLPALWALLKYRSWTPPAGAPQP